MNGKAALAEKFSDVRMFKTCEQCGCCSSACPITGADGFNVRRILRHVELDLVDEIAGTPFPWACTTCGRCESACPNGIAILEIIRSLRTLSPAELVPDEAPCIRACPGNIDVPGYVRLIAEGKPGEAYERILEKVPFPGILGRVCTHPCEEKCRRGEVNAPISICALKRFAADKAGNLFPNNLRIEADTGRRVAVIGAGPAGLTAAFYLRRKGHSVTVFEQRSKPGGMMRYGIPSYRLPEDVLDKEIDQVLGAGIELRTNKRFGRDLNLDKLKADGFEVVFIAVGLPESRKIELEGAQLEDVFWGVEFLTELAEGNTMRLKERVLVVGGGNVAVDVALTALRLGAKEVIVACLESRQEMPANPWEVEMALEEGVQLMPSWGPKRIIGENGRVAGVELVRCTAVFDDGGNFCPMFDEMTETVGAEQVVLAIGQTTDLSCFDEERTCSFEKDLIVVNPDTQETDISGVFAGGDVAQGPGTVIEAIAAGKKAANGIDRFLGGDGIFEALGGRQAAGEPLAADPGSYDGKREKGFADLARVEPPTLPLSDRRHGFSEVDGCFSDEDAVREAKRCLQCDLELILGRDGRVDSA